MGRGLPEDDRHVRRRDRRSPVHPRRPRTREADPFRRHDRARLPHAFADAAARREGARRAQRSEEHTSELQSLMRISYAVFCLKKKKHINITPNNIRTTQYTTYTKE